MASDLPPALLVHDVSARRDVRWWMLLLVGIGFTAAGFTVDPASNCSESGECAPYLVPIAAAMGLLATLSALAWLFANPSRGSRVDLASGEMSWWQGRTQTHAGDHGSANAAAITRIVIIHDSESSPQVHVYDQSGVRLPYLDSEVIPWRADDWARRLVAAWPHIVLDVRES